MRRAAVLVVACCLAGCEPAADPRAPAGPHEANALAVPPAAGAPAKRPRVEDFAGGEVKSVEEYLREPELAAADLERGELLSYACRACHAFDAAEESPLGPNLAGVFGRPAAAREDFDYSDALERAGIVWTPAALDAWLREPGSFIPGNNMAFTGYHSAADRRDLIAYLLRATQQ